MKVAQGQPRTLAFYLPQFHSIPENDEWWGKGFTEWTNVAAARPLFQGHDHPRISTGLGTYDLARPGDVMPAQVAAARTMGIDGLCFYTYWFDGHRLLQSPVDWFSQSDLDFPFCVSWANESWTRRWDGKDHEVLMPQSYAKGFVREVFEAHLPYFTSPSYIRVDEKPLFVVHRADEIPAAAEVAAEWRALAREAGLSGLHLVAAETKWGLDPRPLGFDAVAEFPPVGSNTLRSAWRSPLRGLSPSFTGRLLSYAALSRRFTTRTPADFVRYHGVAPGWDNTARRGDKATVYIGSTPELYRQWLNEARKRERDARGSSGLVFINAYNEWAEGAYLEPDQTWGDSYARATRPGARAISVQGHPVVRGRWTSPQYFSAGRLLLGSILARARRLRASVRRSKARSFP